MESTEFRGGGQRVKEGTYGFRGGQITVEETEGHREDSGPYRDRGPKRGQRALEGIKGCRGCDNHLAIIAIITKI
jgi:hypothetical protein